jgi:hypothetical protein
MSELQPGAQTQQRMSGSRKTAILGIWMFPYLLAGLAYFGGVVYEPAMVLRGPVLAWPIAQAVYGWLLLLVLLSAVWLVGEFFSVTSRETVVAALQWDAVISSLTAIIFTGWAGWFIGTDTLEWWFIVPWGASVIDALTAAWLSINNAAQKPFLSKRGTI